MQKSLRCKDSRLGFGILILFGIRLVIPKFRITRRFLTLASAGDLPTPEELSSLRLPDWLKPNALRICCSKMFRDCFTMTKAGHLRPSSLRWLTWGIMSNGLCLTAPLLESPRQGAGCSLSAILIPDAPEKYFLSSEQTQKLLYKSSPAPKAPVSTTPAE